MTGYAQAFAEEDGFLLRVTLRSVNHRFLDLHLHLPEALLPLEMKIRRNIKDRNPRGHLDLKVTLEREGGTGLAVDEALLGTYVEVFRRLGAQYGLPGETDIATLAQLPGVVDTAGSFSCRQIAPQQEATLLQTLQEALTQWDAMRAEEGRILGEDLRNRIVQIQLLTERTEQLRQEAVPQAQQRFRERLQALLGQTALDDTRLAQEAALLADRTDVSEEILRLKAHAGQFQALLRDEADVGKKLDFLLQEMHREMNTLLSKTAGLGASGLPMTQLGLEIRAEVEKLREQAQNLQ